MRIAVLPLLFVFALPGAAETRYLGAWISDQGSPAGAVGITSGHTRTAVSLNILGQERVCTEASVEIRGSRMSVTCRFSYLQEPHAVAFRGEISGNAVKGRYEIRPLEQEGLRDEGSWQAQRRP